MMCQHGLYLSETYRNMKYTLKTLLIATIMVIGGCSRNDDYTLSPYSSTLVIKDNPIQTPTDLPLTRQELDQRIVNSYLNNNDFHWTDVDMHTMWSAATTVNLIAVGYQPADFKDVNLHIHEIDVESGAWKDVHDALVRLVINTLKEKGIDTDVTSIVDEDDDKLPIIVFRTSDKDVMTRLFNLKNVRYVEPYGYWPQQWVERSSSGCSVSTEPLNSNDWTSIAPSALLPWNFNNLQIPNAWNTSQGAGVRIGVIDAGLSSTQPLLGSQFNDGLSAVSRTITTDFTLGTSAFTTCTHGTSMCATAAGPRNTQNATTGVAYKSNLHFIRACNDVVLDQSSELSGVKKALTKMGDLADIRIISMSIGTPFSSGTLRDGATYAFNKGKLIMAAAGTSFSITSFWSVIYPAAYPECVAVTGVKENGTKCASCHDGSQVLFTVPMERDANSNRNSLALKPSTVTPSYIGGSSVATSTAAGIAALVYAARPTLNRSQVVDILCRTAQNYPTRSSTKGFGNLNASAAVSLALTY